MHDLQKASMLKRISAYLFDLILLMVAISGAAFALSAILGFVNHFDKYEAITDKYLNEYGITLTDEEYSQLSDEQKVAYDKQCEEADKAFAEDEEANNLFLLLISQSLLIVSISILIGMIALEFVVPLIFGNGQTLGKKIFGIAVMYVNSTRLTTFGLFVRTVLGKYTVETMIPVFIILMIIFGQSTVVGFAVLLVIFALQIILLATSGTNTVLHDKISSTVAVDMQSQMIFESVEEMMEYKQRIHKEAAEKKPYF